MLARSAQIKVPADGIDDAVSALQNMISQYREQQGYKGFLCVADRSSGDVLGMSFWESEADLQASDELGSKARQGMSEAGGGQGDPGGRKVWEVLVNDQT